MSVPHFPGTPGLLCGALSPSTIQHLKGTLIQKSNCLWALGWFLFFLLLSGASGIPFSKVTLEHTPTAP